MSKAYSIARINKDQKFDGQFYFAVKTTGVFCRPSCPSPVAKEENVEYYQTVFDAIGKGYRPCLRCRPDIYTDRIGYRIDAQETIQAVLDLIHDGFLNEHSVGDLADQVAISERHLRKLFAKEVGISPVKLAKYQRAVFAKHLLLSSNLSMTHVAFAAGFGSISQFNHVFQEFFAMSPRELKRTNSIGVNKVDKGNTMTIPYKGDIRYDEVLAFMSPRLIEGVEYIDRGRYVRTFRIGEHKGHFAVENNKAKSQLELQVFADNLTVYKEVYYRVKRMFDVDTDLGAIQDHFSQDPWIGQVAVPRLPVAFDPYEFVIRAILGQVVSIKAATTLAARIAQKANVPYKTKDEGLWLLFPTLEEVAPLDLSDIGTTKTKRATIANVNHALLTGSLHLTSNQTYEDFVKDFTAIRGIGDWTANYMAMRGLGMADAFPADDLWVKKFFAEGESKRTKRQILDIAKSWKPYRAYGTLSLWAKEAENVL